MLQSRLEGKTPLGRPRRIWEENIKMDLREVDHESGDWTTGINCGLTVHKSGNEASGPLKAN